MGYSRMRSTGSGQEVTTGPHTTGRAFDLVYRDDDVVVVDKAPGILTVPTPKRERFTLLQAVSSLLGKGGRSRNEAWVVHRLDRDTSGLVVFACHKAARDRLVSTWSEHERTYAALVAGIPVAGHGEIRSRLVTEPRSLKRHSSDRDDVGEVAITHVVVDELLEDAALLSVRLATGRRNQIRVHLAESGHPILGDERYGGRGRHRRWNDRRLALHARTLGFFHPATGEPVSFDTGLPDVFERFMHTARRTSLSSTQHPAPKAALEMKTSHAKQTPTMNTLLSRSRSDRPQRRPR
jgi:23S rRNA pseudouridine1911/1915/1917 synthase